MSACSWIQSGNVACDLSICTIPKSRIRICTFLPKPDPNSNSNSNPVLNPYFNLTLILTLPKRLGHFANCADLRLQIACINNTVICQYRYSLRYIIQRGIFDTDTSPISTRCPSLPPRLISSYPFFIKWFPWQRLGFSGDVIEVLWLDYADDAEHQSVVCMLLHLRIERRLRQKSSSVVVTALFVVLSSLAVSKSCKDKHCIELYYS